MPLNLPCLCLFVSQHPASITKHLPPSSAISFHYWTAIKSNLYQSPPRFIHTTLARPGTRNTASNKLFPSGHLASPHHPHIHHVCHCCLQVSLSSITHNSPYLPSATNSLQSHRLRRLYRCCLCRRCLRLRPAPHRIQEHGPLLLRLPHPRERGLAPACL